MILGLIAAAALNAVDIPGLMKSFHDPGAVVVVVDHGRVIENRAFGVKNIDTQDPVDVHTRFEIGSITKQFTAAAILQLKEAGRLSLDDKLGKYVPEYARGRNITLRQMLLQISGIPNYTEQKAFADMIVHRNGRVVLSRDGSLAGVIAMIKDRKLDFAPGTKWEYSNSNYYLLGRVVEVASGQPWSSYVVKNIFARAHMAESSFMEHESAIANMATGYGTSKVSHQPIATGSFSGWAGGAGTIVSTASDLAKWDSALFGGEIIRKSDLAIMVHPSALDAGDKNSRYAFGWVLDRFDGQPRIWHNGGTLGFSASNQIYPQQQQAVIVLTNFNNGSDELANATFDGLHPELAVAKEKAVAGEDAAITVRAKAAWDSLLAGTPDRSQFTDDFNKEVTDQVLAGVKAQVGSLGEPTFVYQGKTEEPKGVTAYSYRLSFQSGVHLKLVMGINKDNKIEDFYFNPG